MFENSKKLFAFLRGTQGSHRTKTVRSGLWVTLSSLSTRAFELVSSILLARLLLPEIFGLMNIVLFVRNGIEVFTQTSFKEALIYRRSDMEKAADTAWVLNVIRGVILFALAFLAAPGVASFYHEPMLSRALRFMALLFLADGFTNINMVLFHKSLDFQKIALTRLVGGFLYGVVVISLAFVLKSLWALLFGLAFQDLYNVAVSYIVQKKRPHLGFHKKTAGELIHYSKYVTGAGILVFLTTRGDDALIGKILNMKELGYYAYAYLIANLPATHITHVFSEVFFPSYSAISDDLARLKRSFLAILKFIAYISIPTGTVIFIFSREIVTILLGPRWEPAVLPLKILVLFGVVRSLAATTGPLFKAVGKPNIIFWVVLGKLIVILSIIYPLTRYYGISGAAVAVTVPMAVEQLYLWLILKKNIGADIGEIFQKLTKPILTALAMAGILTALRTYLPPGGIPGLALDLLLAVVLWAGLAALLDKEFFVGVLKNR